MKPVIVEGNPVAEDSSEEQHPYEVVEVMAEVTEDDLEGKKKI